MAAFTVDGRTLELALQLIEADLADKTTMVQYGHPGAIPSFETYQRVVGHIMGLMAAKEFLEQARKTANEEASRA